MSSSSKLPIEVVPLPQNVSSITAYLAQIGRKGGLKGGSARAAKLTKKRRSEIASKAAKSRWRKYKKQNNIH